MLFYIHTSLYHILYFNLKRIRKDIYQQSQRINQELPGKAIDDLVSVHLFQSRTLCIYHIIKTF